MWLTAASEGNLKVLKSLNALEYRNYPTYYALKHAALHGHRDVMEWIYDERMPSAGRRVMEAMAEKKDLDAFTWLHERHPASQIGVSVLEAMVTGERS